MIALMNTCIEPLGKETEVKKMHKSALTRVEKLFPSWVMGIFIM